MRFTEIIKSVLINIKMNKFRVFLTMLGIIVGSATIVSVIGIGLGGQKDVAEQFAMINAEAISISTQRGADVEINDELKAVMIEELENVENISISAQGSATVKYNNLDLSVSVVGGDSIYFELNSLQLAAGNYFTEEDDQKNHKVVVIGSEVVEEFFDNDNEAALGERLVISGKKYEIIGTLKEKGATGFMSYDSAIVIPYQSASRYVLGNANPQMTVLAAGPELVDSVENGILNLLDEEFYKKGGSDSFRIRNAGGMVDAATSSADTLAALLAAVALIVLVVGGIGIMNVLFVSVKERTREIGIYKAIGAKKKDILWLFMLEAVFISSLGGVFGLLISIILIPLIRLSGMTYVVSFSGYLLGFVFSIVTGIFFGIYPAMQAAKLRAIDALRSE